MAKMTRAEYLALSSELQALATLASGKNPDDTDFLLDVSGTLGALLPATLEPDTGGLRVALMNRLAATQDMVALAAKGTVTGDTELRGRTPADGDALMAGLVVNALQRRLNPAGGVDTVRSGVSKQLLASGVRAATYTSPDQFSFGLTRGVFTLNVTAVPTVETLILAVDHYDIGQGGYVNGYAQNAAVSATGVVMIICGPGLGTAAVPVTLSKSYAISPQFRVRVIHSAGGDFTYSLGYVLTP